MGLQDDIEVDESKFTSAAEDMRLLKDRTDKLKQKLSDMYDELVKAVDTPAGHALQLEAKDVLLEPVENMSLVINHISSTLDQVIETGYYKDIFTGFDEINNLL